MGIFNRLFGGKKKKDSNPNIIFGRYSDSYKSDKKYDAWDAALEKFESQDYQESFLLFFEYLLDESQNNVLTRVNNGRIDFEILQGSKKIVGFVDDKIIKAEAKVAKMEVQTVGFLRRMVEGNFSLKYSRYALDDDNNLTLLFDSYLLDGSPYKLYYACSQGNKVPLFAEGNQECFPRNRSWKAQHYSVSGWCGLSDVKSRL
jgi:uncharacterized protein with ParB-like and HNH nuclease domain